MCFTIFLLVTSISFNLCVLLPDQTNPDQNSQVETAPDYRRPR